MPSTKARPWRGRRLNRPEDRAGAQPGQANLAQQANLKRRDRRFSGVHRRACLD